MVAPRAAVKDATGALRNRKVIIAVAAIDRVAAGRTDQKVIVRTPEQAVISGRTAEIVVSRIATEDHADCVFAIEDVVAKATGDGEILDISKINLRCSVE